MLLSSVALSFAFFITYNNSGTFFADTLQYKKSVKQKMGRSRRSYICVSSLSTNKIMLQHVLDDCCFGFEFSTRKLKRHLLKMTAEQHGLGIWHHAFASYLSYLSIKARKSW